MFRHINTILACCAAALLVACVVSVCHPIHFQRQVTQREKAVKERLLHIRDAEERYRKQYGAYTDSWTTLINEAKLAPQCQYIPYADSIRFQLQVSNDVALSGQPLPLVQCEAHCETYLNGLNTKDIQEYIRRMEMKGAYPGLKFGDISKPNNNATNW